MGICSTTYGDLVCRGCKRFAHEIVAWNGYAPEQQQQIWTRLNTLRDEVIVHRLRVSDTRVYQQYCEHHNLADSFDAGAVFNVLGHLVVSSSALVEAGLVARLGPDEDQSTTVADDDTSALSVMRRIDREIYAHAQAHYERNFKIPV